MNIIRILFPALVWAGLAGCAFSAELPIACPRPGRDHPLRPAVELYRRGWNDAAMALAAPLAGRGEPDAWFLMGLLREEESPARMSRAQAMDLAYRKAAEAGHPEAARRREIIRICGGGEDREPGMKSLEEAVAKGDPLACRISGEVWLRGFADGKRNADRARDYWRKAAELGDVPSLVLLGKLAGGAYAKGPKDRDGVDEREALACYRKAAAAGDAEASLLLGGLLLRGGVVPRDESQGRQWLESAIRQGEREAHAILGDDAAARGDRAKARELYDLGIKEGDSRCMMRLGCLLLDTDETDAAGLGWLERAAGAGDASAAARLGKCLLRRKPVESYRYLMAAARNGIRQAQADLGLMYLDGALGCPDPQSAAIWLTEAAKLDDPELRYRLGSLYEQGIGTPVNYANAAVLYGMASNKGHAAAAAGVARLSLDGLGMRPDPVQAWAYAAFAAERGDGSAAGLVEMIGRRLGEPEKAAGAKLLAGLRGKAAGAE